MSKKKLTPQDLKILNTNVRYSSSVSCKACHFQIINYSGIDYYLDIDGNFYIKEVIEDRRNRREFDRLLEELANE